MWGELRYLKAELQYVKVVTDQGRALVLLSLRDAVAQLPAGLGLQPHRSYWVAWDAIRTFRSRGRQGELVLSDGTRDPVSRRNCRQVREAWEKVARTG